MRLLFLVSGGGVAARAVATAADAGLLAIEDIAVICDRPSPVIEYMHQSNRRGELINFSSAGDAAEFHQTLRERAADFGADWVFLHFNRLVKPDFIADHDNKVVNLHLSLLPLFPGFGAIKAAIDSGMKVAGATFHYADETVDGGKIIAQSVTNIQREDDTSRLGWRLFQAILPLELQLIRNASTGDLTPASSNTGTSLGELGWANLRIDDDILRFASEFCTELQSR